MGKTSSSCHSCSLTALSAVVCDIQKNECYISLNYDYDDDDKYDVDKDKDDKQ